MGIVARLLYGNYGLLHLCLLGVEVNFYPFSSWAFLFFWRLQVFHVL